MQRSRSQNDDETCSEDTRSTAAEDAQEHLTAQRTLQETLPGLWKQIDVYINYCSMYRQSQRKTLDVHTWV